MDPDKLKAHCELAMEGYDDLPANVRRRVAAALHNINDTKLAAALFKSKIVSADQLVVMIRESELNCHAAGVADGTATPVESGDFVIRRRTTCDNHYLSKLDEIHAEQPLSSSAKA
jgi:hypothetical protein